MKNRIKYIWIMFFALGALILGIGFFARSGQSMKTETTTPDNEIVLTIGETDHSVLNDADALRKAHKYKDAIVAYQKVLDMQGIAQTVRAEAEYDIGLSHTWLGEFDKANTIFIGMLTTYKDDPNAVGYAQFCLVWLEVQKGKYREAITRLESSLAKGNITDKELAGQTQFLIGRTYLLFLNNPISAKIAFNKVRDNYPETIASKHPYVKSYN